MADTKITQLQPPQSPYSVVPATDVLPIVVIADPGMAASGSTRKVTVNQILGSGGTATLASATITGALTVDTTTLVVNPAGYPDRVGIGTASPAYPLQVQSAAGNVVSFTDGTTPGTLYSGGGYVGLTFPAGTGGFFINPAGNFNTISTNGVERVRIDSGGNVGIGVTPSAWAAGFKVLQVGSGPSIATNGNPSRCDIATNYYYDGANKFLTASGFATAISQENGAFYFQKSTATSGGAGSALTFNPQMTLDASGNLGIGVTPSAWNTAFKAIELLGGNINTSSTANIRFVQNAVYTTSGFVYKTGGLAATNYLQSAGAHTFFNAPVGTNANDPITFTQAMTLDASGRLLVGTPVLNASWDTRLTLSSDIGTTRWAVGPYAAPQNFVISAGAGTGVYLNGTAATSWTSASDERLKDIIEPISNAIAKVGSLRAVIGKFKFDENNTRKPFLIAQDIQSVLPEAVDASNPEKLGVAYTDVIPLLVAAIKELTAEVNALKKA